MNIYKAKKVVINITKEVPQVKVTITEDMKLIVGKSFKTCLIKFWLKRKYILSLISWLNVQKFK